MATKKLGRGKGALRRDVTSPVGLSSTLAAASNFESVGTSYQHEQVLECRVTDIQDVSSFWAQIGTG